MRWMSPSHEGGRVAPVRYLLVATHALAFPYHGSFAWHVNMQHACCCMSAQNPHHDGASLSLSTFMVPVSVLPAATIALPPQTRRPLNGDFNQSDSQAVIGNSLCLGPKLSVPECSAGVAGRQVNSPWSVTCQVTMLMRHAYWTPPKPTLLAMSGLCCHRHFVREDCL